MSTGEDDSDGFFDYSRNDDVEEETPSETGPYTQRRNGKGVIRSFEIKIIYYCSILCDSWFPDLNYHL